MTRSEWMSDLRERLSHLPQEEREAALSYYEEYFDEAGADREQAVMNELGSPAAVASRILADHAVKAARQAPNSPRKGLSALWFVLLAVFAAPLALPAFFGLLGIVIAVIASIFAIGVAAVALMVGGIGLFFGGIVGLFTTPASALVLFGAAFLLWGLVKIIFSIIGAVVSLLGSLIAWLFDRPRGGRYGK